MCVYTCPPTPHPLAPLLTVWKLVQLSWQDTEIIVNQCFLG